MTEDHEEHLQTIKDRFFADVDNKYRAGQVEHGGKLWEKKKLITMAIEEAVDILVYLYTLEDQLDELSDALNVSLGSRYDEV